MGEMPPRGPRPWEAYCLCAGALLLFAARFFGLGAAPFLNDEPMLQLLLDQNMSHWRFPTLGLKGSFGMRYGPTALWLYLPLRFLTANVSLLLAYHALCLGGGILLFFLALRRSLGLATASWAALLAAASPFLFFYSRHAWDNTFLVLVTGLILYAVSILETDPRPRTFALLGLACGLAFNIHLMSLPLLASVAWICYRLLRVRSLPRAKPLLYAGLGSFFIPLLFYVPSLIRLVPQISSPGPRNSLYTGLQMIQSLGQFLSTTGMEYFFDTWYEFLPDLIGNLPTLLVVLDIGLCLRVVAVGSLFWCAYRMTKTDQPLLVVFGVVATFATFLFYLILAPAEFHPHYFMGIWWMGFLFAALAISGAGQKWARFALKTLAVLTVISNIIFVAGAFTQVHAHYGTRGMHFGTEHRELARTVGEICGALGAPSGQMVWLDLQDTPSVFTPAIVYFSRHLADCEGHAFSLFPPSDASVGPRVKLGYSGEFAGDARLVFTLSAQP